MFNNQFVLTVWKADYISLKWVFVDSFSNLFFKEGDAAILYGD